MVINNNLPKLTIASLESALLGTNKYGFCVVPFEVIEDALTLIKGFSKCRCPTCGTRLFGDEKSD